MTLRTLMQAGPAKANELFARLTETSDGAVKTRERLFAELKTELEAHVDLEEQHLFPVLRKHAETKELVAAAVKDNKDLRAMLAELDTLPKSDEGFLTRLSELRKAFRQHARDETKELLPAVQKALSEEQVQGITKKMETSVAEAEQARHEQEEERRLVARREREAAEAKAQQEQAAERERQEQAEAKAREEKAAEKDRQAVARRAREAAEQTTEAMVRTAEVATDSARQISRTVADGAQRAVTASAAPLATGFMFWDAWLGVSRPQSSQSVANRHADRADASSKEQVIPLAEEVLTVGTRKVTTGTAHVRRYVVETPVERQVTLVRERVVVERRKPVTDKIGGDTLTEVTVEMIETDEVPVVGKIVRLKEEVVVRTERTEHVEIVRDTVRHDEVEIDHADTKRPARLRSPARA